MRSRLAIALLAYFPLAMACIARPAADYVSAGRDQVHVEERALHDAGRDRQVPYTIFRPSALSGRHAIVLFSHGNGGTRHDATYIAEHLASHGYVVLHVQHAGSDAAIWAGAQSADAVIARMKAAAADRRMHDARYRDVPAVLDELAKLNSDHPALAGHLDLDAVGMSGHSWGALTTLVLVGARDGLDAASYEDNRIKAAIAISPSLPRVSEEQMPAACRDISVPMLHITGTADSSPVVPGLNYEKRLGPYQAIAAPDQYLLVLNGADHMLFPGVDGPLRKITAQDQDILRAVKAVSLAFWDAYLRKDEGARQWLGTFDPPLEGEAVKSLVGK